MRFIITTRRDETKTTKDDDLDPAVFTAYMKFNEELHTAGVLVASEELFISDRAERRLLPIFVRPMGVSTVAVRASDLVCCSATRTPSRPRAPPLRVTPGPTVIIEVVELLTFCKLEVCKRGR